MPTLRELQEAFRRGILTGDAGEALGSVVSDRIPAAQRFGIHRTNTFGSLTEVLGAAYPVVQRLMGEQEFRSAARAYIRLHPPNLPQLSAYGGEFAAFLTDFASANTAPWLADVARLEWARIEAYFAPDATPLSAAALQGVAPEHYPALRFTLHPSVRVVASPFPVAAIWRAHQPGAESTAPIDPQDGGERVVVTRPAQMVVHRTTGPGGVALLEAVAAGATLATAAGVAMAAEAGFDLQGALLTHLAEGTFIGFSIDGA